MAEESRCRELPGRNEGCSYLSIYPVYDFANEKAAMVDVKGAFVEITLRQLASTSEKFSERPGPKVDLSKYF